MANKKKVTKPSTEKDKAKKPVAPKPPEKPKTNKPDGKSVPKTSQAPPVGVPAPAVSSVQSEPVAPPPLFVTGVRNGYNKRFSVNANLLSGKFDVFVNNVRQASPNDYSVSVSGNEFILVMPPSLSDRVEVRRR